MLGPLFHHTDFDAASLAAPPRPTVSVCLPAQNEEATVGAVVAAVVADLVEGASLVDEVVVMDDGSDDRTAAVAAAAGARVVETASVLPELGPGAGKGDALWKSLYVTEGDLVCWIDADLRDFGSHYVVGLLGPLLTHPGVSLVKGFYDRGEEGGRVTELVARPLIARFFPHLAGIVQPLGGEYAARRELLAELPFVTGWGVELGLLVDVAERQGAHAIAQVDLDVRRHRNRPLAELGAQAEEVLATALLRAGVTAGGDEVGERPPMASVPAYQRLTA